MIRAIIFMLIAMASITSGASLAKTIFPVIGPEMATALRLSIAAIILCLVFRPWRHIPKRHQLKHLLFYGIALGSMNLLFYLSIARIPLGIAIALEFTGPLAVALFGTRHWHDLLWACFAATGIVLLLPLSQLSATLDLTGIAMALGAGVFWATYIVAGKRVASGHEGEHSSHIVAWGMLIAAAVATPVGLAVSDGTGLTAHIALLALAVALLSSAIPYSLEMAALKKLPTKTFGILTSMEPAIGALSGYLFLAEYLTTTQMLAIGCIMIASIGSIYSESRRKPLPPLV